MRVRGGDGEESDSDISLCNSDNEETDDDFDFPHESEDMVALANKVSRVMKVLSICKLVVPDNPKDAETVLDTALTLGGLSTVVQQCSQVLQRNLDSENAIKYFRLATAKGINCLLQSSKTYILKNFMTVHRHKDLNFLFQEQLLMFLTSDELNITSEEIVFAALLKWIRFDVATRKSYLGSLITAIRLYNCDIRFLRGLRDHHYLWNMSDFQDRLAPVIQDMENNAPDLADRSLASKRQPNNGE